jgi:hypothetical protein
MGRKSPALFPYSKQYLIKGLAFLQNMSYIKP